MDSFLPYFIASFVATCAWTILVLAMGKRKRRFLGLMGAWAATLVLAALWQAEAVPWLWGFIQGVVLLWLGAIVLLIVAVVLMISDKEPGRRALLCCALFCIIVNFAAGLLFLWIATVSPGGV